MVFTYAMIILLITYFSHHNYYIVLAAPILLMGSGYPFSFLLPIKKVISGRRFAPTVAISCLLSLTLAISIAETRVFLLVSSALTIAGAIIASLTRDSEDADQVANALIFINDDLKKEIRANRKKALTKSLAFLLFSLLLTVVLIISISPPNYDGYTELYITGPDGRPDSVPREVVGHTNFSIIVGLVNHEKVDTSYEIQVWLVNSTTADNWTDVSAAFFIKKINVQLPHVDPSTSESWEPQFETMMTFNLNTSGSFKLFFLLSKGGDPELPSNLVPMNNYVGYEIEDLINKARRYEVQSVNINLIISEPEV